MQRLETVEALRRWRRSRPGRVALVPTMGALHEGHLTHVDLARRHADDVVVSVFVNPTQFGPHEDFERYPRTLDADVAASAERGASAVFCPAVDEVYPPGVPDAAVDVPALTGELEGAFRPGHFQGVCRVVTKLLLMTDPDFATFGRKDLQQLRVVQAMVRDLAIDVEILEAPTVREADGLALSSRNRYLSDDARQRALGVSRSLEQARRTLAERGEMPAAELEARLQAALSGGGLEVDYAVVRDAAWLGVIDTVSVDGPAAVGVVTVRIENTRLLDNLLLNRPDPTYRER